ncbi:MAG TPA: cytochrome c [Terracidiphilus sp.]|jgi:mono/diheme cytochrome c family protein|nr:cytochrome c [Terracidiphilus sp.]
MKRSLPRISVVASFAILLAAPASLAAQAAAGSAKITPQLQQRAKDIYKFDCALCHNANGDGKTDLAKDMNLSMSDWSDPKILSAKSDQELFDIIRKGSKDQKMPPEDASRAKDSEVQALVQYIRSLPGSAPAAPTGVTGTPQH